MYVFHIFLLIKPIDVFVFVVFSFCVVLCVSCLILLCLYFVLCVCLFCVGFAVSFVFECFALVLFLFFALDLFCPMGPMVPRAHRSHGPKGQMMQNTKIIDFHHVLLILWIFSPNMVLPIVHQFTCIYHIFHNMHLA